MIVQPSAKETTKRDPIDPREAYVLVVEDNLQNLVLIARLLAFVGVRQYEWKASGWQVLEFADSMPRVDLVLMDLNLPRGDGFNALAKLRSDPRFVTTRIIAVTAEANSATMQRVRQAGFDGFLGKPLNPDTFPEQIVAILRGESIWDLGQQA